ncbi:MAG: tetratricopeptide repeat protein [Candidatus Riflebacteria bacterium]|nr:tetratricopeptide repeat protein [Candidatus Riflebacteria bacterium]
MWDKKFIVFSLLIFLNIFFPLINPVFSLTNEEFARKKAEVLIEKGLKARESGKLELAVEAFQDAAVAYPKNFSSLVCLAQTYAHVGMHRQASALLDEIPITALPPEGRALVYLLKFSLQLEISTPEMAANSLVEALKSAPDNQSAKIRLAFLQWTLGMEILKLDLKIEITDYSKLDVKDCYFGMLLELNSLNLFRAWDFASQLSDRLAMSPVSVELDSGGNSGLLTMPVCLIFFNLPLALGKFALIGYYFFLSLLIVFFAKLLIDKGKLRSDVAFVCGTMLIVFLLKENCIRDFNINMMRENFFAGDPIWIVPFALSSSHLLFFFLSFEIFLLSYLPPVFRTQRREIYFIWFFALCFCFFVLVFQCRMNFFNWFGLNLLCLFCSIFFSFFLPTGRYFAFFLGELIGRVIEIDEPGVDGRTGLGDAWMLEARAERNFGKEEFSSVLKIAEKVFSFQKKSFLPKLWLIYARSLLELEKYSHCGTELKEYLLNFKHPPYQEEGQIIWALLKSLLGDHAGAYGIVESIPTNLASWFTPDQKALLMFVIARYFIYSKNLVEANIELNKGFGYANLPLNRLMIATELCGIEEKMNRSEKVLEMALKTREILVFPKSLALKNIILSIAEKSKGNLDKSSQLAKDAVKAFEQCSKAKYWLAVLYLETNETSKAESLLESIPSESEDAIRLIAALTTRRE